MAWIKAVMPPQFTWSSVSSITGRDGKTYRLTDILNINDGNAVNDVAYDGNLDFSAASKVNNLIADVVQDESKVTVNYEIPEDNYQYMKLVYKYNEIPEDIEDGTAISLSSLSGSVEIEDIADGRTYWFVIITDKSSSEPKEFTTDKIIDVLFNVIDKDLRDNVSNIVPYIQYPQYVEWDSTSRSIHTTGKTVATYGNSFDALKVLNASVITLILKTKVTDNSIGQNYDVCLVIQDPIDSADKIDCIAFNGPADVGSSEWTNAADINNRSWIWSLQAPLDVKTKGKFYDVKFKIYKNGSSFTKIECYVDGDLYGETSISNQTLSFLSSKASIYLSFVEDTYLKEAKLFVSEE